jgi:Uma2 family endonuclease
MANVASPHQRMTIADFLTWSARHDGKFELHRGQPLAMAPPTRAHGQIAANASAVIHRQLAAPCRVVAEAGIAFEGEDTMYQPDLVVTCTPHVRGERMTLSPILIAEVLSESTERKDRQIKLPSYRMIPSVREIVLIDPERAFLEIHRRADDRWYVDLVSGIEAVARLESIGVDLPLGALYDGIDLEP